VEVLAQLHSICLRLSSFDLFSFIDLLKEPEMKTRHSIQVVEHI
jgi:hypothetical protein